LAALLVVTGAAFAVGTTLTAQDAPEAPTFSRDVLPLAQKHCQSCHRPGQIGPFSMLSYETTRPWARSIKARVVSRQMPPWFADPHVASFANDRSLTEKEIDTFARWADAGAPLGDPAEAPQPVEWPDGWQIKPDLIVRGPEFRVPARPDRNVIEWANITIPSGFTKDTWVTSIEIKPSDLTVTHHLCISFSPHRPNLPYYRWSWSESPRDDEGVATDKGATAGGAGQLRTQPGAATGGGFVCYVPGVQADDYRPLNAAKLIPAGSDINVQVHYTPSGREVVDRPLFGFTVSDKPPERQWISYVMSGAGPTFAIPPNDGNYASPPAEAEFTSDAWLVQMMPHMHLRGKDMRYELTYPDGRKEVVLSVPRYDFNWQLVYQPARPIFMPKGTQIRVDAHYDNSTANKFNPNPNNTVYPGRMTWEEMMAPFFSVIVDGDTDPRGVMKLRGQTVAGDGA
jgi:hypothetical protein